MSFIQIPIDAEVDVSQPVGDHSVTLVSSGSGVDEQCGDTSSGTSVYGYDGDNDDNDTVCGEDDCLSTTSAANQLRYRFGDNNNSNNNNNQNLSDNCLRKWIFIGSTVLSRWTDGLYYIGLIVQINANVKKCLIQFEDSSLYWIRFEDLHKQLSVGTVMADSDILCVICRDGTSEAPNEIVICDVCNQGYHQKCHKPRIGDEILEPDIPWTCRLCVFALGTKLGGAEKNGVIGRALRHMKTEFPYDMNSLDWDDSHQTNHQKKYCYCGGNGHYYSKMLQCSTCLQWFHEACIQALETPLLYGDHYYTFKCSVCSKGKEQLKRIIMKWSDMIALVINNLALQHQKRFFDLSSDIVTFIQNNSNMLKMSEDIKKLTERELQDRISAVLYANQNRFINGREVRKKAGAWALRLPFPFETPLIFAPPSVLDITSSAPTLPTYSSPVPNNSLPSQPNRTSKMTASSAALMFGACRKGASKFPALNTQKSKDFLKNGRSNSCSSSTGSNSCNASTLSFSSRGSQSTASLADKKKAKIRSINKNIIKRQKTLKRVSKFPPLNHNNSDDSTDTEVISLTPIESLDSVIPVPKNFDGNNNPFSDAEPNLMRNRLSKSPISPRKEMPLNDKRISCKIETNAVNGTETSGEKSPKMECFLDSTNPRNDSFNILAQRVRPDGKIEYLLEWNNN